MRAAAMRWAAESLAGDNVLWTFFAGQGVLGVVAFLLGRGALQQFRKVTKDLDAALERERLAVAQSHERERQQTKDLIQQYLPTMQEVTRVLADVLLVLRDADRDRRR
jgi:hypothetical protein